MVADKDLAIRITTASKRDWTDTELRDLAPRWAVIIWMHGNDVCSCQCSETVPCLYCVYEHQAARKKVKRPQVGQQFPIGDLIFLPVGTACVRCGHSRTIVRRREDGNIS